MKLTSQDALKLAKTYREAAKAVGDYLYENWDSISSTDRSRLRSMDVTLMNVATDLVTHAVGIVIDEGQASLSDLSDATKTATNAVNKIADVKKAIVITTALIGLAAAIPTNDMGSIFAAFQNLQKATVA